MQVGDAELAKGMAELLKKPASPNIDNSNYKIDLYHRRATVNADFMK